MKKTNMLIMAFSIIILTLFFINNDLVNAASFTHYNKPQDIRVRLASGVNIAQFRIDVGDYQLIDGATGMVIGEPEPGENWIIERKGTSLYIEGQNSLINFPLKGPILLMPTNKDELNVVSYSNVKYRDTIRFSNEAQGIEVINELELDKYLYGVVGPEIGTYAEMEALKAQAVASRSYALSRINPNNKFDINADVSGQVYKGYSAEILPGGHRVVAAVDDTRGQVIYYDNELVEAVYHANAGGYTASSENIWNNPVPYLRATPSPYDIYALEFPEQSGGYPANTFKWIKTISIDEAKEMVYSYNIGDFYDLSLSKYDFGTQTYTLCGRITEMQLHGTNGSKSVLKDDIRKVFGLRSTKFDVDTNASIYVKNGHGQVNKINSGEHLKAVNSFGETIKINGNDNEYSVLSSSSRKTMPKTPSELIFKGYGHGHGVGMSQWGARGMAADGYNYRQIIEHYYNQGKNDGKLQITKYY